MILAIGATDLCLFKAHVRGRLRVRTHGHALRFVLAWVASRHPAAGYGFFEHFLVVLPSYQTL